MRDTPVAQLACAESPSESTPIRVVSLSTFQKPRWGRTSFAQNTASGRLEINVADVMLAEHSIEGRQVFAYQLLKVSRGFAAALLQLFLNGRLLGSWWKIRIAIELAEQILNLL